MSAAPPFAGRRSELAAVLDAVTGPGAVGAVITGEAGIGKSRLVAEAATRAEMPFVAGWCQRLATGLPFLPFIDVLRGFHELDGGATLAHAVDRCPEFVRTELSALIPEIGDGGAGPELPSEGWRRERLFDSVRRLFSAVRDEIPVVVVVEDLHWADASTLELLDYLLSAGRCPLPLLLTCRVDEADHLTLETITNRAGRPRLDLHPLSREETREQVIGLLGGSVRESQVDQIYRRAGGNAFFTEQLASAASDRPGAALPAGLQALLFRRVGDTDFDEQRVIAALAVSGRPLDEAAVEQVSGWTASRVREVVRGLMRRRLVRSAPDGYALRHALLGEAVLDELLGSERVELHRSIGELLSQHADPALAGEVAGHFEAARSPAQEFPWRVRAARHAETVLAPGEALAHWRRVIALWDTANEPQAVGTTLPDVYWSACQAASLAGRGHEGRELAEAALARCASSATTAERARMYFALGHSQSDRAPDESMAALREAIRLGDTLPPGRDHASALFMLAQDMVWFGRGDDPERVTLLHRALEVATRCDAPGLVRMLRASMATAALTVGDRHTALKLVDEVLALDADPQDPQSMAGAANDVCFVLSSLAQYERAADFGMQVLAMTAEQGYPGALDIVLIRGNTIVCLQELGRVPEAVRLSAEAPHRNEPEIPNVPAMWTQTDRANLAFLTGDVRGAVDIWERCRAESDRFASPILARELAVLGVEILIGAHRQDDAVAEGIAALETCADTTESADCGNLFSLTARAAADLADLGRALDDATAAGTARAAEVRLDDLLSRCRDDPFDQAAVVGPTRCDKHNWTAELTRLAGRSDPDAWDVAARGWEQLGTPHRVAYARYRQAEAHLATPRGRAAAAPLLREATRLAVEHVPLTAAIDELVARAHLIFGPIPAPPHGRAPHRLAALTERELAVLREIARGRTNTQIGADLFISAKTASVHVSNILRKLNVGSRVQAAAVAAEHSLVEQPPGSQ